MIRMTFAARTAAMIATSLIATVSASAQSVYVTQIAEIRRPSSRVDTNRSLIVQRGVQASGMIDQNGRGNVASIEQRGNGSAMIAQRGDANVASIVQMDARRDVSSIRQYGTGNVATAAQSSGSGVANSMAITQLGERNYAVAQQSGGANTLNLLQTGNKAATVIQSGQSSVDLAQIGFEPASISLAVSPGQDLSITQDSGQKLPAPVVTSASQGGR